MITHLIYHIVGKKVGCTKDVVWRKKLYLEDTGAIPEMEVIEELHDKTDQEAGDIEWSWADKFGYKHGAHYTQTLAARSIGGKIGGARVYELGLAGYQNLTSEQRSAAGRKGGSISGRRKAELRITPFHLMTFDEHSSAGKKGSRRTNDQKLSGFHKRGTCPHCGIETNLAMLKRWHLDKCRNRHQPLLIVTEAGLVKK